MKGSFSKLAEASWRVLRRTDVFLILLSLAVCLLMVQRYGGARAWVESDRGTDDGCGQSCAASVTAAEPAAGEQAPQPLNLPKAGEPVRFLMYNIESYFVPGEISRSRYVNKAKSPASREAVAEVIASIRPEVVGLIEIGGPRALQDLRERLGKRGLSYPHGVLVQRPGEDRALALLSQHPVVNDDSKPQYGLYGQQRRLMLRGILDVTIGLEDGRQFRFVGAHLKSRVSDDPEAAEALRKREAQTVARYLHRSMSRQPEMPVLLFGDWNDGPDDESVQILRQGISKDSSMVRLKPKDSRGEYWTIFHRQALQYYTFDQMYANHVLNKRIGRDAACGVADVAGVGQASDHRPLWIELH